MTSTTMMKASTRAAAELAQLIENGLTPFDFEADDVMGQTDCPDGCEVESDGNCSHGYLSAARTLGLI